MVTGQLLVVSEGSIALTINLNSNLTACNMELIHKK